MTNIPLFIGIYKGTVQQNIATWVLWMLLDIIAATTIILQHGNIYLPIAYVMGSSTITVLLVSKRNVSWTLIETVTSILVVACLIIWWQIGPQATIVASTTAICLAFIPMLVDTVKKPSTAPTGIYFFFCIANTCSLLGGTTWSIEQKLYPGAILLFCIAVTVLSMRKEKSEVSA